MYSTGSFSHLLITCLLLSDGKGILPIYMVFIYMGIYMGVNYPTIF